MSLPEMVGEAVFELATHTASGKVAMLAARELALEALGVVNYAIPASSIGAEEAFTAIKMVNPATKTLINSLDNASIDNQILGLGRKFDPGSPFKSPLLGQLAPTMGETIKGTVTNPEWLHQFHSGWLGKARFNQLETSLRTEMDNEFSLSGSKVGPEAFLEDPKSMAKYEELVDRKDTLQTSEPLRFESMRRLGDDTNFVKMPWLCPVNLVSEEMSVGNGSSAFGQRSINIAPPANEGEVSARALVNMVLHESEHQEQDHLILAHLADRIQIGVYAQRGEIRNLASLFKGELGVSPKNSWLVPGLGKRAGRVLTPEETERATGLIESKLSARGIQLEMLEHKSKSLELPKDIALLQKLGTQGFLTAVHENPAILSSGLRDVVSELPNPSRTVWTAARNQQSVQTLTDIMNRMEDTRISSLLKFRGKYMGMQHEREAWAVGRLYSDMLREYEPVFQKAWENVGF